MKKMLMLIAAATSFAGCRMQNTCNDVVKETYIHKYGVPVTQSDWDAKGQEGQVVSLRKDGVTVTTSYVKGVVDGPTTYSFPNSSTVRIVNTFSQGKLVGTKENYLSGVPMKEELYEEHGLVKQMRWYEDGTPQAQEIYHNTFLMTGEYRTPVNVVESRVTDGHGTRICRANEGDLLSRDTIQNGQLVERVTYYPNGDPSTVTAYENGVMHGTRLTFLQGGLPRTVEQWVQGVQEGITIVYVNGEKVSEVPYVMGKKNGVEYRYRDGTVLVEEVTWKEDVQHGPRKLYVDQTAKTEWYHEGEVVSRSTFERLNLPMNMPRHNS